MGRRPATVIEYRSYELPSHFPMRIIAGEDWRISDVPCGVLHFHNCLEIGLCESDGGKIDFAGHVEDFHAGDVTVIAGDVPHTTWSDAGTASKWAYLFCDPEELLRPFFALDTLPNARLLDGLLHGWCRVLSPQQNPALAPLVRQMLREMTQKGLNYQISVRGLFVAFITELMRLPAHGDIGSLTNRYESQLCAIEKEASLIIICNGAKVGRTIQHIAAETGVAIMSAPCDTYAAAKLISQCAPISYYMTRDDIMKFTLVTPVADVTRVMAKVRHRYFPILDADGKYCGMISRRNIINLRKRRIILVDHNEATQAVEGFDQAEILEIIDHHRIGSLETSGPVYFRNQPVGCTATIVTQMYDENGVTIPQKTAGLLLAAILSDTLVFRSPTCTPIDVNAANRLAKIAGVDINEFANEMFEAGEKLDGKTAEEVFLQDFKVFMCGDIRFGVAQGSYMTRKNLTAAEALLKPYLEEARNKQNVEDIYMLLTDVPKEESVVICNGRYAAEVLTDGFDTQPAADASWTLPGVVSRKKQFIPALMTAYQEL